MSILNLIFSLKNIKNYGVILLFVFSLWSFNKIKDLNHEKKRLNDNFINAIKTDSLEATIYRIKSEHELESVLSQNKNMANLVEKSKIENKRLQSLYYNVLKNKDTTKQVYDVSGIVDSIVKNINVTKRWVDSTKCLTVKGFISYENGNLTHGVDFRETINKVALIKSKGRREPVKWLLNLRLGKRETKFTPVADCGEVKVTIVYNLESVRKCFWLGRAR